MGRAGWVGQTRLSPGKSRPEGGGDFWALEEGRVCLAERTHVSTQQVGGMSPV